MDSRGVLSLRSLYFSSFYFREIEAQPGASFTHRLVPSTGNAKADCAWGQMSGTETSCPANSRPLSLSLLYLGASLSVKDDTQDPSTQHPERRDPWSPRAARRPPSLGWTPRGSPGDLQGPDAQARYRGGGSLHCCALSAGSGSSRGPAFAGTESCRQLSAVCPGVGTCSPPDTARWTPHAH